MHRTHSSSILFPLLQFSLCCNRSSLCIALIDIAAKQDASSSLLNTLASSLLSSFSPSDVISVSGRAYYAYVLQIVSSLSSKGYLAGSAQLLADLVSVFTGQSFLYDVTTVAFSLIRGIQLGMASGQDPVFLVTPIIQLFVTSTLIFTSSDKTFTPPASEKQLANGSILPKITLGSDGLKGCGAINEYAQLSVLQWSINPYANSTAVQTQVTPILSFAYANQVAAGDVQSYSRVLSQLRKSSVDISLARNPAYYLSLQYSSVLNYNFSAISGQKAAVTRGLHNFTVLVPACVLYNGSAYGPCENCALSSFTNYNVTFKCFDITQLCPSNSARRRLKDEDIEVYPVYSLSYCAVLQSVEAEFHDVLSSNPFKLDLLYNLSL